MFIEVCVCVLVISTTNLPLMTFNSMESDMYMGFVVAHEYVPLS